MEPIKPSHLRADLYRILDRVLDRGEAIEITRRGRRIRLVADASTGLDALKPHPEAIQGNPEDIVSIDWSDEWRP